MLSPRGVGRWVRDWTLWTLATPVGVAWMLVGELVVVAWAAGASVTALQHSPPTASSWVLFGMVAAAVLVHVLGTRVTEERRRVANLSHEYIDHIGTWTVMGSILLPPYFLVVMVIAVRWQRYRLAHKPPAQVLFGTAGILCSALATNALAAHTPLAQWAIGQPRLSSGAEHVGLVLWLLAAAVVYYLMQTVMLGVVRALWRSWTWRDTVGSWRENADFVVNILFGLVAAVVSYISPFLVGLLVVVAVIRTRGARLLNEAVRDAQVDNLTNLYNDRGFEERAIVALAAESPAALLVCDLDHLKKLNDVHGHPNANLVLAALGRVLQQATRELDLVSRWGGDEFVVLLPNTTPEDAKAAAERMRSAVAGMEVQATKQAGGARYTITGLRMSIGVALAPIHGETLDVLRHVADSAMYLAKAAGRDCVCVAPAPDNKTAPDRLQVDLPSPRS